MQDKASYFKGKATKLLHLDVLKSHRSKYIYEQRLQNNPCFMIFYKIDNLNHVQEFITTFYYIIMYVCVCVWFVCRMIVYYNVCMSHQLR